MINIKGRLEENQNGGLVVDGISIIDILCDLKDREINIIINDANKREIVI